MKASERRRINRKLHINPNKVRCMCGNRRLWWLDSRHGEPAVVCACCGARKKVEDFQ